MNIRNLLKVSQDDRIFVQESLNKSKQEIDEEISEIKRWITQQDDIPHDIEDERLTNLLMRNKFRGEKTKRKLKYYYEFRRNNKDWFDPDFVHPQSEAMKKVCKLTHFALLPNLTPKGERAMFFKFRETSAIPSCLESSAFGYFQLELAMSYDFSTSERLIVDLQGFSLRQWLTYDLFTVYKTIGLYKEGYSARIAGWHILNAPYFVQMIVLVLKSVIKEDKIHVHKNIEELYEHIPQEYLPSDYGGRQGYMEDLQKAWLKEMEVQMGWVEKNYKTDEMLIEKLKKLQKEKKAKSGGWFAAFRGRGEVREEEN